MIQSMGKISVLLLAGLLGAITLDAQAPGAKALDIYFLDTEGGQATLFIAPSGQSMLVDTGFAGNQGMPPGAAASGSAGITRDADRITTVLKLANVSVLDYLVITHYHGDHVGNAAELAGRIPIRHFIDHGPYTVELQPTRAAGFAAISRCATRLAPRQRNRATGFPSPVWTCGSCPRPAT